MRIYVENLTRNDVFLERLKQLLEDGVVGKFSTFPHAFDGHINAQVSSYEVSSEFRFGVPSDNDGGNWTLPFETMGEATLSGKSSEGEYASNEVSGPCRGLINIQFDDSTINSASIDLIAKQVDLKVDVESVALADPVDSAELDQQIEKLLDEA